MISVLRTGETEEGDKERADSAASTMATVKVVSSIPLIETVRV